MTTPTATRPTVTVHKGYDGTVESYPLPDRFDTVAQASAEARANGATVHEAGATCWFCTRAAARAEVTA